MLYNPTYEIPTKGTVSAKMKENSSGCEFYWGSRISKDLSILPEGEGIL
jgi:hypothetical protein